MVFSLYKKTDSLIILGFT